MGRRGWSAFLAFSYNSILRTSEMFLILNYRKNGSETSGRIDVGPSDYEATLEFTTLSVSIDFFTLYAMACE